MSDLSEPVGGGWEGKGGVTLLNCGGRSAEYIIVVALEQWQQR